MKRETGCDAVMIGRAARGNPWLFRAVRAVDTGQPIPDPPTVSERRTVWRRHADLVAEYAVPKMVLHELRKTLAWYSRGLHSGAEMRHRCFAEVNPSALVDLGEAFFAALANREASHGGDMRETAEELENRSRERLARRQPGGRSRVSDKGLCPAEPIAEVGMNTPRVLTRDEEMETCDV